LLASERGLGFWCVSRNWKRWWVWLLKVLEDSGTECL
jgi:hypothetical protein